ncbi:MAG TPA: ABC transporter ATP-binding protein [Rhizobiaceae bacterium]|nr:ABC transporter ATP-binding protein [Rhizobiaceae bacterium]
MTLLSVQDLDVSYGGVQALHGVSLSVERGELVAILGANGAGKTTLLRAISGLLRPARGTINFDGKTISDRKVHDIARMGLSHVPEGRGLLAELTVMENLRLGLYVGRAAEPQRELDRVLQLFPILSERSKQPAGMLSGGEQQMLAIARSLVSKPKLLIVDELSLGLAPKITTELLHLLSRIHKDGVTVLMVDQNAHQLLKFASRIYVLANGSVALSGTKAELVGQAALIDAYLGKD